VPEAKLSDLIEDMDRARVRVSLVVLHEETDEFFRLAAEHPGRVFGLAYYDSLSPHRGLERVQGLCHDYPHLVLGVATAMPGLGQDPRLRDFVPLYEFCEERGLPVQFHGRGAAIGGGLGPMAYAVLAKSYPRLRVVCQHGESWCGEALALLGGFPNLFLQVDGLSLHTALRATDSRKLLFGSGWRGREAGYFERAEGVRRLPWWQRRNVGWRTAVRVHGSRILCPSARSNPQPSSR
jgi:predicted TIM-barrel fold metal-dependent hydrolase